MRRCDQEIVGKAKDVDMIKVASILTLPRQYACCLVVAMLACQIWFAADCFGQSFIGASAPKKTSSELLQFSDCVVMVIDSVDIPAKESGILATLNARIGQEFESDSLIGTLDNSTALLEDSLAAVQAQVAVALSRDQSDLKFAELVLEEAKIGLESYEQINLRGSATDSEMRAKRLAVTQAELKVQHAQQALEQLKLKARLAQASSIASRQRLDRLNIVAPFQGSVAEIHKHRGEWVQAVRISCDWYALMNFKSIPTFMQRKSN